MTLQWRTRAMTLTHEIYNELKQNIDNVTSSELSKINMTNKNRALIYAVTRDVELEKLYFSIGQEEIDIIPQCKGLGTNKVKLYEYSKTDYFCELYQKDKADTEVFEVIIEDVRKNVNDVSNEVQMLQRVSKVLLKWRTFFTQEKSLVLSSERQQGLYGELLFLKKLISWYGPSCILYWTGADYETHDYYINHNAVEIKTTSTKAPYKMHISSEYQLDDKDVSEGLFVVFFALRKSVSDGETLPEIINSIRKCLTGHNLLETKFNENLQKYGYFDGLEDKYSTGYHVREEMAYSVKSGFPRITKEDLPKGISGCKYDVSVEVCSDYCIDNEMLRKTLKRGEKIG